MSETRRWPCTCFPDEAVDASQGAPVEVVPLSLLDPLLTLILNDMRAATNRDLACDGPVGDEEGKVWAQIEAEARRIRQQLSPERCEARDSVGRCVLPKGHAEQHDHGQLSPEED
jgi:hypothetical protein